MTTLIKRKGKWFKLKGLYNSKTYAYKKGYSYRKVYGKHLKYVVIPLKNGQWGLYCT